MINIEIISVEEYTDILIECHKDEILAESTNQEMIEMYNHHIQMIRAYVNAASEKKSAGLLKECKLDLEKAKAEIMKEEKFFI